MNELEPSRHVDFDIYPSGENASPRCTKRKMAASQGLRVGAMDNLGLEDECLKFW